MTASKNQPLAVEHSRLGIITEIDGHRVTTTSIVNLLKAFAANGDKLRLIVSRTTRFSIPLHTPRPQDICLSLTHAVNIALQFFIGIYWHLIDKIIVAFDVYKGMIPAIFRILSRMNQMFQHSPLQCLSPVLMLL